MAKRHKWWIPAKSSVNDTIFNARDDYAECERCGKIRVKGRDIDTHAPEFRYYDSKEDYDDVYFFDTHAGPCI